MKVFAFIVILITCDATAALAGPIEDRQALMKSFALPLKDATSLSRGSIPYDAALAKSSMAQLSRAAGKLPSLFRKGTEAEGAVKTTASPMIWSDSRGFNTAAKKFSKDAKIAGGAKDAEAFAAALKTVQGDCGSCHKTYRLQA